MGLCCPCSSPGSCPKNTWKLTWFCVQTVVTLGIFEDLNWFSLGSNAFLAPPLTIILHQNLRKSSLKINNVGFVLWESHNISPSFGFTGQTPGSEFDFWFFPLSLQIRPTLGGFSGYCLFSGYPMFSTALTGNLSVLIDIHVLPLKVCLIGVRVRTNSLGLDRIMS